MNAGFVAVNGGNGEKVNRKWLTEKRGSKMGNGDFGFQEKVNRKWLIEKGLLVTIKPLQGFGVTCKQKSSLN